MLLDVRTDIQTDALNDVEIKHSFFVLFGWGGERAPELLFVEVLLRILFSP